MRKTIFSLTLAGTAAVLSACSGQSAGPVEVASSTSAATVFVGSSGLAVEEEVSSRLALDLQEAAAVQAAADAAAAESQQLADEAAAQARAEEQAVTEEAAASSSVDEGDFDDGYVTDGLESACAQGTASIEECFGPGSDLNNNGVADVNEIEYEPEAIEPDYPAISCDVLPDGTPICEGG